MHRYKKILVTGGSGFTGSHFVRHIVETYPECQVISLDKLTYAADTGNLADISDRENYTFVEGDISDFDFVNQLLKDVDAVVHLAAESHVDNSIGNSLIFTTANTLGTHVLLEAARLNKVKRFLHVSTDEVYGDIEEGSFREDSALNPNNPYAASKAGADMLARSYHKTYNLPVVVVRGNNIFGPYQYPEKIIPKFTTLLLQDKKLPMHGDGSYIRTFIYVKDFVGALEHVFSEGEAGEVYNIGTTHEISNLDLTKLLIKKLGKSDDLIEYVADRPFNDRRYSVDLSKIKKLGWNHDRDFEEALDETIEWYKQNESWWKGKSNNNLGEKQNGSSV